MRFTEPINYVSLSTEPAFPTKKHSDFNHGQLHKRKREDYVKWAALEVPGKDREQDKL